MKSARSFSVAILTLLLALSTNHASSAQQQQQFQRVPGVLPQLQQIQPAQPSIKTPGADTTVKPTGGVAEYKCDSEKNTCKCTSSADCNKMRTDKVCKNEPTCHEDDCWCTWR